MAVGGIPLPYPDRDPCTKVRNNLIIARSTGLGVGIANVKNKQLKSRRRINKNYKPTTKVLALNSAYGDIAVTHNNSIPYWNLMTASNFNVEAVTNRPLNDVVVAYDMGSKKWISSSTKTRFKILVIITMLQDGGRDSYRVSCGPGDLQYNDQVIWGQEHWEKHWAVKDRYKWAADIRGWTIIHRIYHIEHTIGNFNDEEISTDIWNSLYPVDYEDEVDEDEVEKYFGKITQVSLADLSNIEAYADKILEDIKDDFVELTGFSRGLWRDYIYHFHFNFGKTSFTGINDISSKILQVYIAFDNKYVINTTDYDHQRGSTLILGVGHGYSYTITPGDDDVGWMGSYSQAVLLITSTWQFYRWTILFTPFQGHNYYKNAYDEEIYYYFKDGDQIYDESLWVFNESDYAHPYQPYWDTRPKRGDYL